MDNTTNTTRVSLGITTAASYEVSVWTSMQAAADAANLDAGRALVWNTDGNGTWFATNGADRYTIRK